MTCWQLSINCMSVRKWGRWIWLANDKLCLPLVLVEVDDVLEDGMESELMVVETVSMSTGHDICNMFNRGVLVRAANSTLNFNVFNEGPEFDRLFCKPSNKGEMWYESDAFDNMIPNGVMAWWRSPDNAQLSKIRKYPVIDKEDTTRAGETITCILWWEFTLHYSIFSPGWIEHCTDTTNKPNTISMWVVRAEGTEAAPFR